MMENYEDITKKWYTSLYRKSDRLNPGLRYGSIAGRNIKLSDIFIPQNVVQSAMYGIGRSISTTQINQCIQGNSPQHSVDQLLGRVDINRHLIVGELGVGKTCLLNHICFVLSDYRLNGTQTEDVIVKAFRDKFVAFISMSELKKNVDQDEIINFNIYDWLEKSINKICGDDAASLFKQTGSKLFEQGILLLVDGIDEINSSRRKALLQRICSFTDNPYNIVIASIRKEVIQGDWIDEYSYFQTITLARFENKQILQLITNWRKNNRTPIVEGSKNLANIEHEVTLIFKQLSNNSYLRELASNPFFLTLMMLISDNEGEFPRSRTKVYEEAIKLIIAHRNNMEDVFKIRKALEEAAFRGLSTQNYMHDANSEVDAFISDSFSRAFPEEKVTERLKNVSESTAIIVKNGRFGYNFELRSFMEYLAASYVSNEMDVAEFIERLIERDCKEIITWWREIIVFSVTRLALNNESMAIAILYMLVKYDYSSYAETIPVEVVMLASLVTIELLTESNNQNILSFKRRIKTWLNHYINDKKTSVRLRFEVGNLLCKLGDDRKGVSCVEINGMKFPDIQWIRIPSGKSFFGEQDNKVNVLSKFRCLYLDEYYISKYPVTNDQFSLFVIDGYCNRELWTKEGWLWLNGKDETYFQEASASRYSYLEDRKAQYTGWLQSRTIDKRREPYWWNESPWNLANRPVVGITWYEAVAYCKWLNKKCRLQWIKALGNSDSTEYEVCLPTLEEWEKAARGPKCYKYPWGEKFNSANPRGNCDLCELNETSAVGIFSESKSGYGVWDMAGNVYEWISTGLVQESDDVFVRKAENLEGRYERFVMGGSWNLNYERMQPAYEEWDYPLIFDQNTGFRPVIRKRKAKQ